MKLRKLIDTLSGLASLLDAAGSKKVAADVQTAVKLVPSAPDSDARTALAELRDIISQEKTNLVASYVALLTDAKTNEASFNDVHGRLCREILVGKEEADAIAHLYTGGRNMWPSRKAALEAIRKKFIERAYQESKMKVVNKYKVG